MAHLINFLRLRPLQPFFFLFGAFDRPMQTGGCIARQHRSEHTCGWNDFICRRWKPHAYSCWRKNVIPFEGREKKTIFDYVWDGMRPCVNVASSLIPFIWPFSHCSDCRWTFDKTFNSPFPEFPVGQGGINNSGSSFFFTKIFSLAIGLLCFAAIWHQQTELLR